MSVLQEYNGYDTIATIQLWQKFAEQLAEKPEAMAVYEEEKALSQPLLYAMLKGILVDQQVTGELKELFDRENADLLQRLDFITKCCGLDVINLGSPVQVQWLFGCFDADIDSSNRESLEQLIKADPELAPIANIILMWRDRKKMLDVLQPDLVDRDGRMRTFYKVAGTDTQRLSSAKNALWTGMNLQNIKREDDEDAVGHANIRSMFIADPGYKFCNIDLERSDSWAVGLEVFQSTGDRSYLDACSARDLHTVVSRLVWPDLGWTDDEEANVAIAEQYFYRQYDYRFMSKKGGHGSNYLGSAFGLAKQMKIPVHVAERFQRAYFRAFKGIPKWHQIKARELQTTGRLTNLFGRVRNVHSRLDSDGTLRALIAFLGQSVTAYVINRIILRMWRQQMIRPQMDFHILGQVHDSGLWQFPEAREAEFCALVREMAQIPITVTSPQGETITKSIPIEVATGWNWAKVNKKNPAANPDGLRKLKPGQLDTRQRTRYPVTKTLGAFAKREAA